MKKFPMLFILFTATFMVVGCNNQQTLPPKTMKQVNLNKYLGKWYEIASKPNYFQKDCQCTTAVYSRENNNIKVVNQCFKPNESKFIAVTGKAWVVNPPHNSKLKVQFFWPFKGDYWIIYVDPNYQAAIVGNPDHKYLWILARTPIISTAKYKLLMQLAAAQGFPISQLKKTNQHCYRKPS